MKIQEIMSAPADPLELILAAVNVVLAVRHSRLDSIYVEDDSVVFDVEFDFPEHLVKAAEVKQAGKPVVKSVTVAKSEKWRDGVFGASYELTLSTPLSSANVKKLETDLTKRIGK